MPVPVSADADFHPVIETAGFDLDNAFAAISHLVPHGMGGIDYDIEYDLV